MILLYWVLMLTKLLEQSLQFKGLTAIGVKGGGTKRIPLNHSINIGLELVKTSKRIKIAPMVRICVAIPTAIYLLIHSHKVSNYKGKDLLSSCSGRAPKYSIRKYCKLEWNCSFILWGNDTLISYLDIWKPIFVFPPNPIICTFHFDLQLIL